MVSVIGSLKCACKTVGENKKEESRIVAKRKLVKEGAVAGFDCVCESKIGSGKKTTKFADSIKLQEEGTGKFEI